MYSSREASLPSDLVLRQANIRSVFFYPKHTIQDNVWKRIRKDKPLKSKKLCKAVPVSCVFNDTQLDWFAKLIPELGVLALLLLHLTFLFIWLQKIFFSTVTMSIWLAFIAENPITCLILVAVLIRVFFSKFPNHIKSFADQLLLDGLETAMLLKHFSWHIQGQCVWVNNTLKTTLL